MILKINSSKLQKFLLLKFALLCLVKLTFSQAKVNFGLMDSLEFKITDLGADSLFEYGYKVGYCEKFIFIYPLEKNTVFKYDLSTEKFEKIILESKNKNDKFKPIHLDISDKFIFTIGQYYREVRKYSWNGELQKSFKPKLFWSKYHLGQFNSFEYDEANDLLYMAIEKKFGESFVSKKPKKANKHFEGKLIGVFNSSGKLLGKMGQYEEFYHKSQYFYADSYSFILNAQHEIVLSQQLSANLSLIDFKSGKMDTCTFKGNYVTNSLADLPKATCTLSNEEYYSNTIAAYGYFYVKQLTNSIYLRPYLISAEDTTKQSMEKPDLELDKSLSCKAPSQRLLNQKKIMANKPQYLQVFDIHSGKVLFDELSPFKGFILNKNINPEYLWTADLATEMFKIYKYSIRMNE